MPASALLEWPRPSTEPQTYVVCASVASPDDTAPEVVAFELWEGATRAIGRANELLDEFIRMFGARGRSSRATLAHMCATAEARGASFRCQVMPLAA